MRVVSPPLVALLLVLAFGAASLLIAARPFIVPEREPFSLFAMQLGSWRGQRDRYSQEIIESLRLHDYLLANYQGAASADQVNLYIAYYQTQSLGSAAHSPRTCIPGGGWEIESLSRTTFEASGTPLSVNRAVIGKGQVKQLVYYWFEQRGRRLASEYDVKWYLFVDGLLKRRSDGALVRVITPIEGRDVQAADSRLVQFVRDFYPRLAAFLPR
jgi:EpsI family protein